jgi:hypothetical protein
MREIKIDDDVYQRIEEEAARLHLSVDTYLSTLLMREVGHDRDLPKEVSGIGLFADLPDSFDDIMNKIISERSQPWRLTDDESIA